MAVGGSGVEALFWKGPVTPGDLASWAEPGVLQDSGGTSSGGLNWTLPNPSNFNDPGTAGEISYDPSGNFYLCYADNEWAKFTGLTVWNNTASFVFDFSNYTTYSQYVPLLVGFG